MTRPMSKLDEELKAKGKIVISETKNQSDGAEILYSPKSNKRTLRLIVGLLALVCLVLGIYSLGINFNGTIRIPLLPDSVSRSSAKGDTSPLPTSTAYICPTYPSIDCAPKVDQPVPAECSPDFLTWAIAHCPGFQGANY